jgi:hypothetical protein
MHEPLDAVHDFIAQLHVVSQHERRKEQLHLHYSEARWGLETFSHHHTSEVSEVRSEKGRKGRGRDNVENLKFKIWSSLLANAGPGSHSECE